MTRLISKAKRILVPTDFSPLADQAIDAAIDLAKQSGGTVELLHVRASALGYEYGMGVAMVADPRVERHIADELAERRKRVAAAGVECLATGIAGRPHSEITAYARTAGADLIVMTTHGRTGMSHAFLGSVAEGVARRTPCPVLILPPAPNTDEE